MTLGKHLRKQADTLHRSLDVPGRHTERDRARILSYLQAAADIGANVEAATARDAFKQLQKLVRHLRVHHGTVSPEAAYELNTIDALIEQSIKTFTNG